MSLTCGDKQEMFLPQVWAAGQLLLWIVWLCRTNLQKIYCQTDNFACNGAVWYVLCLFSSLSVSPLFYGSLADCNSVNDFDLSWD